MCDQAKRALIRQLSPNLIVIDLCGFLNQTITKVFEPLALKMRLIPAKFVILNFSLVHGMDGAGLRSLLLFCTALRKLDRRLMAYGMDADLCRMFSLAGLDHLLGTHETESEALAELAYL